jgi:hypothetical protein
MQVAHMNFEVVFLQTRYVAEHHMNSDSRYFDRCSDPEEWRSLAESLRAAASPLGPKLNQLLKMWSENDFSIESNSLHKEVHVYFMLWAFAIENLLKALLVKKWKPEWGVGADVKALPSSLKGHNLTEIAKRLELTFLLRDFPDLFFKLQECLIWYGRYPVPTKITDYDRASADYKSGFSSSHVRDLEIMYRELETELRNAT